MELYCKAKATGKRFLRRRAHAQTTTELGIYLAIIVVVGIVAWMLLGDQVKAAINFISQQLATVIPS